MKSLMPLSSRLLYTALAIFLPVGSHLADYNKTHTFNPHWTAHAKFHGGQTLAFSILLAILTIFFAWRKTTDRGTTVLAVSAFAAVYFFAQAGAIFYPGTAAFDPEFVTRYSYVFGLPVQSYIQIVSIALTAVAAWLALNKNAKWTD